MLKHIACLKHVTNAINQVMELLGTKMKCNVCFYQKRQQTYFLTIPKSGMAYIKSFHPVMILIRRKNFKWNIFTIFWRTGHLIRNDYKLIFFNVAENSVFICNLTAYHVSKLILYFIKFPPSQNPVCWYLDIHLKLRITKSIKSVSVSYQTSSQD